MYTQLENLIGGGIFLVFLLWLIYGPWQRLIADFAILKLQEIKDYLEEAAENHMISRSSSQYIDLNKHLDSMMENAQSTTWVRLIWFYALLEGFDELPNDSTDRTSLLIRKIKNNDLRRDLDKKIDSYYDWGLLYIILRSPLLIGICILLIPILLIVIIFALLAKIINKGYENIFIVSKFKEEHIYNSSFFNKIKYISESKIFAN